MKKTLKAAVALSVFAAPAYAANLENPLYMPSQGSAYSKTSAGVMYKIADDTAAMKAKDHDGATEFPIWRLHEELGYSQSSSRPFLHGWSVRPVKRRFYNIAYMFIIT